ncbi:MAG: phosphate ABC transporter permease subunit PstC [Mycobacteriales bacterium]|nr:MAG: phosphate ABC transporter permease subunit PstC [Pseudonocardiales bacterium]
MDDDERRDTIGTGHVAPRRSASSLAVGRSSRGDVIFRQLARGSGILLLLIIIAIAAFLVSKAVPAIAKDKSNFLTFTGWDPDGNPPKFGIAPLAAGTLITSALALIMGVPVAVGVALFISHYAPRRMAQLLGAMVDLLAAVPSIVYGLFGLIYLVPAMAKFQGLLHKYFGFIPIFSSTGFYTKSLLVAGVVLAIMILPIVAAISREVFLQTPREHVEAALALGATKWEVMRTAVIPYGRPGIISATVLGFGRALGETIAVALVLPITFKVTLKILDIQGNSIAAEIAVYYGDAGKVGRGALIAAGLVLFAMTLLVNLIARAIVARRRDFRAAAA